MELDFSNFPVHVQIKVQWGHMDAFQHVNNTMYLRWVETSRIAYFDKMNLKVDKPVFAPILGWQDCKYIFPLTFPDTAIITCKVKEVLTDRVKMVSEIYSKRHQRIAAISHQEIIAYDYKKLKKINIPENWSAIIDQLES